MNYRLTISYDGTRYHGWESKKEVDTIEGKLEAVFARMTNQDVFKYCRNPNRTEVIGNIFDNPELLEQEG